MLVPLLICYNVSISVHLLQGKHQCSFVTRLASVFIRYKVNINVHLLQG